MGKYGKKGFLLIKKYIKKQKNIRNPTEAGKEKTSTVTTNTAIIKYTIE